MPMVATQVMIMVGGFTLAVLWTLMIVAVWVSR